MPDIRTPHASIHIRPLKLPCGGGVAGRSDMVPGLPLFCGAGRGSLKWAGPKDGSPVKV